MYEILDRGVRLAFIDEMPATCSRGKPVLLIHGFASTHAVNWIFPLWVKTLTEAGRRVIAFDNRGHGRSEKFYDPAAYSLSEMAEDARALLDALDIAVVDVMGYSLGARIAAFLAKAHGHRLRRSFRSFAEATKSDLKALAACVRGARQALTEAEVREINIPILIVMGTEDRVGGDPHALAVLFKRARTVHIPGHDHNRTVGDKVYKASILDFLDESP